MEMTGVASSTRIEWMTWDAHRHSVWAIDRLSFPMNALSYQELGACLRDRHNAGRVLLIGDNVVGFMIERFHFNAVEILTLAVDPAFLRLGFGATLIENSKSRAARSSVGRQFIETTVSENNLPAQLFLRSCGFRYVQKVTGSFDSDGHPVDGYQFVWKVR